VDDPPGMLTLLSLVDVIGPDGGRQYYLLTVSLGTSNEKSLIRFHLKLAETERRALIDPTRADQLIYLARMSQHC
jgi:hypothetical protein